MKRAFRLQALYMESQSGVRFAVPARNVTLRKKLKYIQFVLYCTATVLQVQVRYLSCRLHSNPLAFCREEGGTPPPHKKSTDLHDSENLSEKSQGGVRTPWPATGLVTGISPALQARCRPCKWHYSYQPLALLSQPGINVRTCYP